MGRVPNVALITSRYALTNPLDADRDLALIRVALQQRGVQVRLIDWRDEAADLTGLDLILIKSPWDYASRADEFLAFLAAAEAAAPVLNHPELIRWNLDKRYLAEVAERGVAVCPTTFCTSPDQVRAALAEADGRVVVKPHVSAASADTGLFEIGDAAAVALAEQILADGKVVLVQPAVPSVAELGERSLIHFGGRFEHCIRKGPLLALGGGLRSAEYVESITAETAPDDERQLAAQALATVAELFTERGIPQASPPLYARVDIARDAADRPIIMELELFEPSYFLDLAPGAEERYADLVLAACH